MNKINLKERKKNMKQILQNVVNFEKPKVVLARYNSEKHVPLLMEIGGYIIAMKYDEDSNICGTETVYFDRFRNTRNYNGIYSRRNNDTGGIR